MDATTPISGNWNRYYDTCCYNLVSTKNCDVDLKIQMRTFYAKVQLGPRYEGQLNVFVAENFVIF